MIELSYCLYDSADRAYIFADVAGCSIPSIKIFLQKNLLEITAERRLPLDLENVRYVEGSLSPLDKLGVLITIPGDIRINRSRTKADVEDGILKIVINKTFHLESEAMRIYIGRDEE
jgi:HSP20 family molecular chaperone IbpA